MKKLQRYYAEIDELDEQEDGKSPYLARAIYLANEADAVLATLEAENERLREVLKNLLQDTQHSNHHCKDTIENCPVLAAKAILNREQEKPSGPNE